TEEKPEGDEPEDAPLSGDALLASQVRTIFEQDCFRCHGQDGNAESGVFVLDRDKLVSARKVVPGDPDASRLFKRVSSPPSPIPPVEETPRPSAEDIALTKRWTAAGAPPCPEAKAAAGSADTRSMLTAIRDHLLKAPEKDRRFLRYFTLANIANDPAEAK